MYFAGITDENRRERRQQMLTTANEKFLELADQLDALAEEMNSCVVANIEALKDCGEKLAAIKTI